jgi:hypothetical protein
MREFDPFLLGMAAPEKRLHFHELVHRFYCTKIKTTTNSEVIKLLIKIEDLSKARHEGCVTTDRRGWSMIRGISVLPSM